MLSVVKLKNSSGDVRFARWVSGPWVELGDKVLSIGKVTWEKGENPAQENVALIQCGQYGINKPGRKYTVWAGDVDLCIGDTVENFASTFGIPILPGEKQYTEDEYFAHLETLLK